MRLREGGREEASGRERDREREEESQGKERELERQMLHGEKVEGGEGSAVMEERDGAVEEERGRRQMR